MSSMFFSSSDWLSLVFRLTLAVLVGGAIGVNRQRSGRPAGLRTFMVVSLGAAVFVMIPLQVERESNFAPPDAHNAVARITQGVVTGIGFLGGGVILRASNQQLGKAEVKGLTTAASIWLAGGLGAAAGCGLWRMSLIGTLMTLVVLSGVKRLKKSPLIRLADYDKQRQTPESDTAPDTDVQQQ